VFDNEHSLHLWERHPCISTIWRQLTDWSEQVTTWRDLRGLLCSHSDIVCLLIQSNCIESQPSTNILIWIAWLFDHPVEDRCKDNVLVSPLSGLWEIVLMMEAATTSETSVNLYQTTQCNIPKDSHLHTRHRKNLKSHQISNCWKRQGEEYP
jgi:hypothetical protein